MCLKIHYTNRNFNNFLGEGPWPPIYLGVIPYPPVSPHNASNESATFLFAQGTKTLAPALFNMLKIKSTIKTSNSFYSLIAR